MPYYDSANLLQLARALVGAIEALDAETPESWFEQTVVAEAGKPIGAGAWPSAKETEMVKPGWLVVLALIVC